MREDLTVEESKQVVIDAYKKVLGKDLMWHPERVTLEDLQKVCNELNIECTNELSTLILFDQENNLIPCLMWTVLDVPLNKVFQLVPRLLFERLMDNGTTDCSDVEETVCK